MKEQSGIAKRSFFYLVLFFSFLSSLVASCSDTIPTREHVLQESIGIQDGGVSDDTKSTDVNTQEEILRNDKERTDVLTQDSSTRHESKEKDGVSRDTGTDNPCGKGTSFRADVFPILRYCSCHSGASAKFEPFFMTAQDTFRKLVKKKSGEEACNNKVLVIPGDVKNSYLIHKLEETPGICGKLMPPDGSLPEEEIATIKRWICYGAKNN